MMRTLLLKKNPKGYFLQSEQEGRLTATDPRGLKAESCVENFFLRAFLFDLFRSGGAKQGLASSIPFLSLHSFGQVKKETFIKAAPFDT